MSQHEKIEVGLRVRGLVDRAILHEIWAADAYRIRTLPFIPKTVIDIGAHIGGFALLAATAWPGRTRATSCSTKVISTCTPAGSSTTQISSPSRTYCPTFSFKRGVVTNPGTGQ